MALDNIVNKENKPVYNLIYDKEKAEKLKAECDEKFLKRCEDNVNKAKRKRVVWRVGIAVCLVLTFLFAFVVIMGVKNPGTTTWLGAGCIGLAVSVISLAIFAALASSCSGKINYENYHYENKQMEYAYPHLVWFHDLINGREILDVSYEKSSPLEYLNLVLKNDDGCVEIENLLTYPKYSTNVTVPTYDCETGYIYFPFEKKEGSFTVISTAVNVEVADCEGESVE